MAPSLYPPNAFSGTAELYARHRPPYPPTLLEALLAEPGLLPQDALLDLACGPGRLAIPLASHFRAVLALDLEPEMIEVGRRIAEHQGLPKIRWEVGVAEALEAPPGAFGMITIGEAFHRLDQAKIAARSLDWLRPGGWLAVLGSDTFLTGHEPWHRVVQDVLARWTKPVAPLPGAQPPTLTGPLAYARTLAEAGFAQVHSRHLIEERTWTLETIHGYLRTTSLASDRALGTRAATFRDSLYSGLLALNPAGTFAERLRWGYTTGRKL